MRKLALALLLLLPLSLAVRADEPAPAARPGLVVGLIDFPPLSFYDESGQPDGLLVPLMRQIAEEAGYQPEFRILPLARLVQAMQEGSVRVWPGIPGKVSLANHTLAGSEPLARLNLNLYHRPETVSPNWPTDLSAEDLIVLTGYDYGPEISGQIEALGDRLRLHRTHSHSAAIGMLLHRRANYLLDYQAPMDEALAQRPELRLQHVRLARLPLLLIVSDVGKPAAATLLADLEGAYRGLLQSGRIQPLRDF